MKLKFEEISAGTDRKPDGIYSGQGKWRLLKVTLEGKEKSASFKMGINDETKELDIQPVHPDDKDMLISAFSRTLGYKGSRD